jgi:hypothetical protein
MKIVNPTTGNVICGASNFSEAYKLAKEHANSLGSSVEIHPEAPTVTVPGLSPDIEIAVVDPDTEELE